jgi:hypothetical protein
MSRRTGITIIVIVCVLLLALVALAYRYPCVGQSAQVQRECRQHPALPGGT